MKIRKVLRALGVTAAVVSSVPFFVRKNEDVTDIYALGWSYHRKPNPSGEKDDCTVNILSMSDTKRGIDEFRAIIRSLENKTAGEEPEVVMSQPLADCQTPAEESPAPEQQEPAEPEAE